MRRCSAQCRSSSSTSSRSRPAAGGAGREASTQTVRPGGATGQQGMPRTDASQPSAKQLPAVAALPGCASTHHLPVSIGISTEPSPRNVAITASSSTCSLPGLHARPAPPQRTRQAFTQTNGTRRRLAWPAKPAGCQAEGVCRCCRAQPLLACQRPPPRAHRSGIVCSALRVSVMSRAGRWKADSSAVPLRCRSFLRST